MLPVFEMRREDHFEATRSTDAEAGLLTDASELLLAQLLHVTDGHDSP